MGDIATVGLNETDRTKQNFAIRQHAERILAAENIVSPLVKKSRNWRWITDSDTITGNGTSDDTAAARTQAGDAGAAEQTLLVPDNCIIRTTDTLDILHRVRIVGCRPPVVNNQAYMGVGPSPTTLGSFFFFDHLGKGFSLVGGPTDPVYTNATQELHGTAFRGIGTRRHQPVTTGVSFTPVAADYDFEINHAKVWFEDVVSPNPTKWLHVTNLGLVNVKGFRGQPLTEWVHLENCYDINWFDDNMTQLFWSSDTAVQSWMQANLTLWKLGHVDGINGGRFFGLSMALGMFIYGNTDPLAGSFNTVNRGWFDQLQFDACKQAILFDGSITSGASLRINSLGSFMNDPQDGTGAADNTVNMFGSNSTVDIGHFEPGVTRGGMWLIDSSGSNNKVRINKLIENTFSLATVSSSFALRALGNNSIEVDDYVKKAGYSPTSGRVDGKVRVTLGEGFETTTVDASGAVTVAHNCGNGSPTFFGVMIRGGAVQYRVEPDPDPSHCKVTFFNASGTALSVGSPVSFKWRAGFDYTGVGGF